MKEFNRLIEIADQLLGPNGCSWDREQTFFSLQPYLLEEIHELIEAIDTRDAEKIADELGDVFYALVFIGKLGEIAGQFDLNQSLEMVCEKLIRRHPHVFGDIKVHSSQEIIENWEKIKKEEKAGKERKNLFDGIPPTLPTLAKAQKMAKRMKIKTNESLTEDEVGEQLWALVSRAESSGVDAESALRRRLAKIKAPEIGL